MKYFVAAISLATLVVASLSYRRLQTIMATLQQATSDLVALKAQVAKSKTEILRKLEELENQAPDNTSPEFDAALADLKTEVQGVDDMNPDATE